MKTKVFFTVLGFALIITACGTSKQSAVTGNGAAPSTRDELVDDVQIRTVNEARETAKRYEAEGYRSFVGAPGIDRQIENSLLRDAQKDADGQPLYLAGNADVTSGTVAAAQAQALHMAKVNLAAQVNVRLAGLIKQSLGSEHEETLDKFLQSTQELIASDLERVDKVVEVYRQLPNKRYQVQTRVIYNTNIALIAAGKRLLQSLEKEAEDLHKEVSEILNK